MAYIAYKDNVFVGVTGDFAERAIFKDAGFKWDAKKRWWATQHHSVALKATGLSWTKSAAAYAQVCIETEKVSLDMSWKADTAFNPPVPPGLNASTGKPFVYLGFQKAGIEYAIRRKDTLIGDSPGLGKTIQSVGTHNATAARTCLIVCPASLKENWRREFVKWCVKKDVTVGIAEASYEEKVRDGSYKNGNPKYKKVRHVDVWPNTDVVIINYEILERFSVPIAERNWDMLVCDEAHALKTEGTKRTLFVLGGKEGDGAEAKWWNAVEAKRRLFLTGTPMMNRPIELWPLLVAMDGDGLGKDKLEFAYRYCGAFTSTHGGTKRLDMRGASNMEELGRKLREKFMVRRLKREVLPDLPPKRRIIVTLDSPEIRELVAREDEIADALKMFERHIAVQAAGDNPELIEAMEGLMITESAHAMGFDRAYESEMGVVNTRQLNIDYAAAVSGLEPSYVEILFEEMATVRRDLGVAKLSAGVPWIKDFVDGGEKMLIFAYHKDVVEGLVDKLKATNPAVIYGNTPQRKRQGEVDKFQEDEGCRTFIGNMHAAGVGITLTRAHDCCFIEQDWVPGLMAQCEDRLCRIGQEADIVTCNFLVANGSLDARIAQSAQGKEENIEAAMGRDTNFLPALAA